MEKMKEIKLNLEIDGVCISSTLTGEEYKNIKETTGLDPLILTLNKIWGEVNKHENLNTEQQKKQQTVVEFLLGHILTTDWVNYTKEEKLNVINHANELFKKQIIESNFDGQSIHAKSVTNLMMQDNAESYYAEIYNQN